MGNEGWICPKCGKVHAPWVPSCKCSGQIIKYDVNTTNNLSSESIKFDAENIDTQIIFD